MLTRTSAQDYAKDRIYMNSVDTGWINDENPHETAKRLFEKQNFQTPIVRAQAQISMTVSLPFSRRARALAWPQ